MTGTVFEFLFDIKLMIVIALFFCGLYLVTKWRLMRLKKVLQEKLVGNQAQAQELGLLRMKLEYLQESQIHNSKESDEIKKQLYLEFSLLQRKFLDESTVQLTQKNREGLHQLIQPFDQQLNELKSQIKDIYDKESRERFSLKKEIEYMLLAQQKMTLEAQSLTQALRGDVKTQGVWGEIVLERILENSGLREGEEFIVQGRGLKLKTDEGEMRKPDVLVRLPGNRNLIIDSKVTLTSYEAYINSSKSEIDASLQNTANSDDPVLSGLVLGKKNHKLELQEFIQSVRRHVSDLSVKNYSDLYGVNTPDFVLMFIPTDGAFSLAHQTDPSLFSFAMEKRIAIVSPSLLFPNLKTVETIWRQERQSRNAEEIARHAGALYDKFCSLIEDLEEIDINLKKAGAARLNLYHKIKDGRGNLLDRVEKLRLLGAKAKKRLNHVSEETEDSHVELTEK
ncbi:MAG: DNA recombination protein RmuC [Bdellovibrionales bacterium]|nr:DNA recombination protein RmuC [Bdellovibrionales bacterium]